ncbi:glycosyltransferase 87 family protein, partial [Chloroflexota bacterium]
EGESAYEDFDIEYAPLSLPLFLLPRVFAQSDIDYHIAFAVEMLLFNLIGMWTLWALLKRLKYSAMIVLSIYTIGLLSLGPTVIDHFDLAAAVLVLLAIWAFISGKNVLSWVFLALGAMVKIFPIVIVPILALYLLRRNDFASIYKGTLAFAATLVVICLPCMLIGFDGFVDSFTYHSERGLQAESTYASVLLLGHTWDITSIETALVTESGSWEIISSTANTLAQVSPVVMIYLLGILYLFYTLREWHFVPINQNVSHIRIITFAILAITVFMLANKVFSPQYIIWLYPLVPLISSRWRIFAWAIYATIALMTVYIFSYHYDYIFSDHYLDLVYDLDAVPIYILALRNLLLFFMVFTLLDFRWPVFRRKEII